MRYAFVLSVILALPASSSGQTSDPASNAKVAFAGYRMTKTSGSIYLLRSYVKQAKFYVVTEIDGKNTSHLIESVAKIEPLTQQQLDIQKATYEDPGVRGA